MKTTEIYWCIILDYFFTNRAHDTAQQWHLVVKKLATGSDCTASLDVERYSLNLLLTKAIVVVNKKQTNKKQFWEVLMVGQKLIGLKNGFLKNLSRTHLNNVWAMQEHEERQRNNYQNIYDVWKWRSEEYGSIHQHLNDYRNKSF